MSNVVLVKYIYTPSGKRSVIPLTHCERVVFWPTGQVGTAEAAAEHGYTIDLIETNQLHAKSA